MISDSFDYVESIMETWDDQWGEPEIVSMEPEGWGEYVKEVNRKLTDASEGEVENLEGVGRDAGG